MTDEELQGRIEKGEISDNRDSRAYTKVFRVLRSEPEFKPPINLAERVVLRVDLSSGKTSRDMVWLYAGLAACFVAMIVAVLMTDFKVNLGVLKFISGYSGLFVFGILVRLGPDVGFGQRQSGHQSENLGPEQDL